MPSTRKTPRRNVFEKYLALWVALCIVGNIVLGNMAPGVAPSLDAMAISINGPPLVSIPITIVLIFMMYLIMVKIALAELPPAGTSPKPVFLTLIPLESIAHNRGPGRISGSREGGQFA
ncbi:MAG: arsenic resistance protein [Planctomycetota bacterium]